MSTPLLKTKLHIPSSPVNLVNRQALNERLENNLCGQMTLIAAPAGFGKTTFISSWVHSVQHPVTWVSLDESENDPTLFWAYLVSGFQDTIPDDKFLSQINITKLPPIKTLLAYLINILAEVDGKVILVLDDYHLISNPQIHNDFSYLIDHQPQSLHIILVTRADPPLPIAKLRGRGLLTELRAIDLRFSKAEIKLFLNDLMMLALADADINALEKRTEGWIIGLQLAAISMQGRKDKNEFVTAFSGGHHFILEYLTEEVLNCLSKERRHFLLKTSILDQLCDSLCNEALDMHGSGEMLIGLQRDNLFINSLDDDHFWFRYNHLFVDLLGNLLRKEFSPEQIYEIHLRASKWYQKNGYGAESIEHSMQAKEFERAISLIEQAASETMLHGRLTTLLHWLDALPEDLLDTHPRLRFYQAWALSLSGQPKIAEQILLDAKSTLEDLPNSQENLALRGELAALLTGIITYSNDPPKIIQEAQEALTYLPEENLISRSRVYIALGTAYAYSDENEKAAQFYQQARDLALQGKNPFLATAAIEMLAGMQIYHQGQLYEAEKNLQQALALGKTEAGVYQAFTGTSHILLAEINLEWNDINTATDLIERGLSLLYQGGIRYSLPYSYCAKARLRFALADTEGAVDALREAKQATQSCPLLHVFIHNLACQVKLSLSIGDVETAAHWAFQSEIPENLPSYLNEVRQITLARVYLAQNDLEKTLETLNNIYSQAESARRMAHIIKICLVKALALQAQGEAAAALEMLKIALSTAAPEGYERIFLEIGEPAQKLLEQAATQNIQPKYVSKLLVAFNGITSKSSELIQPSSHAQTRGNLVDPLTERECEVLKLIAAGYTNQQVADVLVITLNTVKKHTTHIYGKLEVKNRTQAIAGARKFKLIS